MSYKIITHCGRCGRTMKSDSYDPRCANRGSYHPDQRIETCELCGVSDIVNAECLCRGCATKVKGVKDA